MNGCQTRFIEIRSEHSKKLLFRYDPGRQLIEIVQRGQRDLVDLTEYQPPSANFKERAEPESKNFR